MGAAASLDTADRHVAAKIARDFSVTRISPDAIAVDGGHSRGALVADIDVLRFARQTALKHVIVGHFGSFSPSGASCLGAGPMSVPCYTPSGSGLFRDFRENR